MLEDRKLSTAATAASRRSSRLGSQHDSVCHSPQGDGIGVWHQRGASTTTNSNPSRSSENLLFMASEEITCGESHAEEPAGSNQ